MSRSKSRSTCTCDARRKGSDRAFFLSGIMDAGRKKCCLASNHRGLRSRRGVLRRRRSMKRSRSWKRCTCICDENGARPNSR